MFKIISGKKQLQYYDNKIKILKNSRNIIENSLVIWIKRDISKETYKERIHITKYERDIKTPRKNFVDRSGSSLQQNNSSLMSFYEFVNAWPTNMTSMRVNYGSSDLIRVSVQLSYDRFFTRFGLRDSPRETPMNIPSEQIWKAAANNNLPDFLSSAQSLIPIAGIKIRNNHGCQTKNEFKSA